MGTPTVRPMRRAELDLAVEWAAREGWNPGLYDADAYWAADPEGFLVLEENGEVVGTGSNVSYDGLFGFLGFFIVRPDRRGRGFGTLLWGEMIRRLRARLRPDAAIGLDGVYAMQARYARDGFRFYGRDLRYEGRGVRAKMPRGVVRGPRVPFNAIAAFDARHFPAPRRRFLQAWLSPADSAVFACVPSPLRILRKRSGSLGVPAANQGPVVSPPVMAWPGELQGYAVVRRCRTGYKIGPLFAQDEETAEKLFAACSNHAAGEPLFLDVPERNAAALALAARHGMKACFGCAAMYLGATPEFHRAGVFGVTSFELG